jgi:UTP-glucose-1-phosphate uridylyltransferase
LDRSIFDALRGIKPGAGGDLQLTDAIWAVRSTAPRYGSGRRADSAATGC